MSTKKSKRSTGPTFGVIYARYSSHAQKDASIEQQVAECRKFAAERSISIVEIYADRAISGKTDRRPSFQRMMHDAEKRKFQVVIAWKSNRIGRNMMQAMVNEARLNEFGIRVLYAEEDFDDTAAGRFALRSMMNVNQFYSENMAEDIKRGLQDNAMQAKVTGSLPYGYKAAPDLHYEIDSPKDEVVREIFSRVASGDSYANIIRDLNARGLKTRTGGPWNRNSFYPILSNERYRGIYVYGDIRIEGGIPRIVSDDLFFRAQEAIKMNKFHGRHRQGADDYLLTGKLYCGICKSPMTGVSGTSKTGASHYYYICQKRRVSHTCTKENVRRDWIEEVVARSIRDYCLQDDIIEVIADKTLEYNRRKLENSEIGILRNELADVQIGIKNIMKAIEAGILTETTRSRLLELEDQQNQLRGKIAAAEADIVPISREDLVAGLTMFRDGDIKSKKFQAKLFDVFLRAVYLYDDHLKIVFSFTGDRNSIDLPVKKIDESSEDITQGKVRLMFSKGHQQKQPRNASFWAVFLVLTAPPVYPCASSLEKMEFSAFACCCASPFSSWP